MRAWDRVVAWWNRRRRFYPLALTLLVGIALGFAQPAEATCTGPGAVEVCAGAHQTPESGTTAYASICAGSTGGGAQVTFRLDPTPFVVQPATIAC